MARRQGHIWDGKSVGVGWGANAGMSAVHVHTHRLTTRSIKTNHAFVCNADSFPNNSQTSWNQDVAVKCHYNSLAEVISPNTHLTRTHAYRCVCVHGRCFKCFNVCRSFVCVYVCTFSFCMFSVPSCTCERLVHGPWQEAEGSQGSSSMTAAQL